MSSPRGIRLLQAVEKYVTLRPNQFDTGVVLPKIQMKTISAEGKIRGSFTVDSSMCNAGDTLHGGYMLSVFDAVAFYSQLGKTNGRLCWTTGVNANFLKSANKGEVVIIESDPLLNGSCSVVETTLRNESGTIIAKGTVSLIPGADKFQEMVKDRLFFDVYQKD